MESAIIALFAVDDDVRNITDACATATVVADDVNSFEGSQIMACVCGFGCLGLCCTHNGMDNQSTI